MFGDQQFPAFWAAGMGVPGFLFSWVELFGSGAPRTLIHVLWSAANHATEVKPSAKCGKWREITPHWFVYFRCPLIYHFFGRKSISNDSRDQSLRWMVVFNGSCSSICTWRSKNLKGTFQFRAVASNAIGFGEYSEISEDITLVEGMLTYVWY